MLFARPLASLVFIACGAAPVQGERPTGGAVEPACDVRDEDTRCAVDGDCEYLGTRVEASGQCCYTACGHGATVNRAAAKRLLPERDRINTGPPRPGCQSHEGKCAAGYPRCVEGRCSMRRD